MNRSGFLLLNMLIYIAISTMLIALLFQYSAIWFSHRYCGPSHNILFATQVLMRDLIQAPADSTRWYVKNNSMIAWYTGTQWMSWQKKDEQLLRITGDFDTRNHTWHNKVMSVVVPCMTQFSIAPKLSKKEIQQVTIHLSTPTQDIRRTCCIRNGSIT